MFKDHSGENNPFLEHLDRMVDERIEIKTKLVKLEEMQEKVQDEMHLLTYELGKIQQILVEMKSLLRDLPKRDSD